jgi:DNA polymerase
MEIITADFETYYTKEYSLTKLTTEAYVRDPKFEVIMLGLRWPDGTKEVVTGTHAEIQYRLDAIDWGKYAVLCHNTLFDAAIFTWHFGVRPRLWLDTLSMARAMFGARNNSLAMLAKRYGVGEKGNEVVNAIGMRRQDFEPEEFKRYATYCLNDVQLCYDMWHLMSEGWYNIEEFDKREDYPREELKLIDLHIRMFSEPVLRLNRSKLEAHLEGVIRRKEELLSRTEFSKERLASNPQFAEVLTELGVTPPTKISKTTGKTAFAFAKTDPELKALLDHPDERVQAAVAARLGTKSTLEETRTQTFIGITTRGNTLPVPLKYSYARTKRSSGGDGINLQNLPARGGTELKACIEAPPGYVLIDCDSSNIEARVLAWLAGQNDLVQDFANKVDVYCKMATKIYGREITKADKQERFVGKTVTLGCGYQTGAFKLQATLKTASPPMDLPLDECQRIVDIYRMTYPRIKHLWYEGEQCIEAMHANKTRWFGKQGVVLVEGRKGIKLPSGLYISYQQLHRYQDANRNVMKWAYKDDTGLVDIYGGKLTENIVQALARIIVMSQLVRISKKLRVALTVHDSIIALAREDERDEARAYVESCMRWVPAWAKGLPINCESKWGYNYGEMRED